MVWAVIGRTVIDVSVGLLHGSVMRVQMLREGEVRMNRDVRVGEGNFSSCPE